MAASTLPQLPVELIGEIVSYLVDHDAYAYSRELYGVYGLRLTCRALYEKTLFDFTKFAFSTLQVDFSLQSLDRLYAISQHEELQKAVKCIYFGHHAKHPIYLGKIEREVNTSLADMVHYILEKGLRCIFAGLSNLTKVVVTTPFVATFRSICETDKLSGPSIFYTGLDDQNEMATSSLQGEMYTVRLGLVYRLLFDAANRAGSRLASLEVQANGGEGVCLHSLLERQNNVLRHLRQLRLSLEPEEEYCGCESTNPPQLERRRKSEEALYLMLRNTPQLTLLRISFTSWPYRDNPRRARIIHRLASLHLPHLTAVGLLNLPTEEKPLARFLSTHRDQLRTIYFRSVKLIGEGHWQSLLTQLLNHHTHKLNELEIEYLYERDRMLRIPLQSDLFHQFHHIFWSPRVAHGLRQALYVMH